MRVVKMLAALGLLVALIAGVPALLITWGDPLALLSTDWRGILLQPADSVVILSLLSILGWLAWALLAVTVIVEAVSTLSRQRVRIHLPGIRWLQPGVGALIAMVMTPVLTGQAHEPAPPPPAHAPVVVAPSATPAAAGNRTTPTSARIGERPYVVQAGDELWGLAERELGAGSSWRSIVHHNPGMTADTPLVAGSTIMLPSGSPTAAPERSQHIIVRRGDTLWDLAREHLGDPYRWPELFDANRGQIRDPDEIDIGWSLVIPGTATLPPPPTIDVPDADSTDAAEHTSPPPSPAHPPVSPPPSTPTVVPAADAAREATPTPRPAPASPTPGSAPTGPEAPPPMGQAVDGDWPLQVLGSVGGVLAASVFAGVIARRRTQLLQRGLGRRIATLAPEMQRFFTALVQRSHSAPEAPTGLRPTSVIVGWQEEHDVLVDLEHQRCTLVTGSGEDTAAMVATVITSLLCAPWSTPVDVVTVQPQEDWAPALGDPRLSTASSLEEGLVRLQRLCAERRLELGQMDLTTVRADPDRAGSWGPVAFVFCQNVLPAHLDRIRDCLALGEVGVSVLAAVGRGAYADGCTTLDVRSASRAWLDGTGDFEPQLITQPARRAVLALFASSLDDTTEPAPWWRDGDPPPTVTVSPEPAEGLIKDDAMPAWSPEPDHPTLLVLGPVELLGCRGERPGRAVGQCMEYCAWLLLNPGASPTTMLRELLVAEGTRRSNTSRLRSWLGSTPSGEPYLPDAYSGRIRLDPSVTSDWERFQLLLAGGINTASSPLLREALSLVRGRPLEGVDFQWPWVAQWLTDMLAMITDAASVLADRCLTARDTEGALWAIDQGRLATGDDEALATRRIQALALSGEKAAVDRAVMDLTRAARAENRDLAPESVQRIQHALHLSMARQGSS